MRYRNFDLWIDSGSGGGYPLRANSERLGEARGRLDLRAALPDLDRVLERLAQREVDRAYLIDLGTRLHDGLLTGEIGVLFERSYAVVAADPDLGLRVRLRIEPPEIAIVPWELLYSPTADCFLATLARCPVVRYLEIPQEIRALQTVLPLRMLVAIPEMAPPFPELDAAGERRRIGEALAALGDRIEVDYLEGRVSRQRISDALLGRPYHCFHFIGHGDFLEGRGCLLLNDESGGIEYVDHEQFAGPFRNCEAMKLVVLNACKGAQLSSTRPLVGMAPQLVKQGIPAVVAMQFAIFDEAAVLFAREFYLSLFAGANRGRVDYAMSHARERLDSEFGADRDIATPVLFMRAWDGLLFDLAGEGLPFSKARLGTAYAAQETHRRNIELYQAKREEFAGAAEDAALERELRELTELKRRLRLRHALALCTSLSIVAMFFLAWVSFFDIVGLESAAESTTIGLGELFVDKRLDERIMLVPITPQTEQDIGKPFDVSWRREHARLIDRLSAAGAMAVVFDMYFTRQSAFDDELIEAMRRARERGTEVVLGFRELERDARGPPRPRIVPGLAQAASGLGTVCTGTTEGCARTMPLAIAKADGGQTLPTLALAALAAVRNQRVSFTPGEPFVLLIDAESAVPSHSRLSFSAGAVSRRTALDCPAIEEGDSVAQLILDSTRLELLRAPSRRFPFERVVRSEDGGLGERFRGKIALVGVERGGDSFSACGPLGAIRYGPELHVEALNSLLTEVTIRPLSGSAQVLIMFIMGLAGGFVRYWAPRTARLARPGLLLGVLAVYLAGALYAYGEFQLLLNPLYQLGACLFAYWAAGKVERRWFA